LVDRTHLHWEDRDHFLAACSVVMRNLVIDFVRRGNAARRGGPGEHVTLDEGLIALDEQANELIALDQALTKLDEIDPRLCRVVECRYFAGLSEVEVAAALGTSERTVRRDWIKAKGILLHLLDG
jgi:RNA polymerase sigma factor (TIGR02999 family)